MGAKISLYTIYISMFTYIILPTLHIDVTDNIIDVCILVYKLHAVVHNLSAIIGAQCVRFLFCSLFFRSSFNFGTYTIYKFMYWLVLLISDNVMWQVLWIIYGLLHFTLNNTSSTIITRHSNILYWYVHVQSYHTTVYMYIVPLVLANTEEIWSLQLKKPTILMYCIAM